MTLLCVSFEHLGCYEKVLPNPGSGSKKKKQQQQQQRQSTMSRLMYLVVLLWNMMKAGML